MKVLLRLRGLSRAQHQNLLLATDECGILWPAIEYKGSSHDKEGHNIDLKVETERDMFARGVDRIPEHRDVVDKLWDLLGIFPEEQSSAAFQLSAILPEVEKINSLAKEVLNRFPDLDSDPDRTGCEVMAIDKMGSITTICQGIQAMAEFDRWTRLARIHDAVQTAYQVATEWSHNLPTPGSVEKGSPSWINSMGVADIRTDMEKILRTLGGMKETEIP
jgi:hypothetical protein